MLRIVSEKRGVLIRINMSKVKSADMSENGFKKSLRASKEIWASAVV